MYTKEDFQKAISQSIEQYPSLAPLFKAGDPRVLQPLSAMATMLAMFSAQLEVAQAEPFEKTRDSTILADAAMRGIIPKATPSKVRILVKNDSTEPCKIESGRKVIDSNGRHYRVEGSVVAGAKEEVYVQAIQVDEEVIQHEVAKDMPFYSIPIPSIEDGSFLSGISVSDKSGVLEYRGRYVNTWPGERIYHIEVDDNQKSYVRFGYRDVAGVQFNEGDILSVTIYKSFGKIDIKSGSPFSFEYIQSPVESSIDMRMDSLLAQGEDPITISTLRDLARYPSIYDESAVFLGEFDFLIRKKFTSLRFLSVWNEATEESVRGASLDNINTLFVACLSATGDELIAPEGDGPDDVVFIQDGELTETQKNIKETILRADDSYKVRFAAPVRHKIPMRIKAIVSTSYVAEDVRKAISDEVIKEFGEDAITSKRGGASPLYQRVYAMLKAKIPALSDGDADLEVRIDGAHKKRPELWQFVDPESLEVEVVTANVTTPNWGF